MIEVAMQLPTSFSPLRVKAPAPTITPCRLRKQTGSLSIRLPSPGSLVVHLVLAAAWLFLGSIWVEQNALQKAESRDQAYSASPVLISYSYFEKDAVQRANFDFFLTAGITPPDDGQGMHWVFTLSTPVCTPCKKHLSHLTSTLREGRRDLGVARIAEQGPHTLLLRSENVGMDLASHNITFQFLADAGRLWQYHYFFLINSSTRGPLYPAYMPPSWHWTRAFLVRFSRGGSADVHAVGSSLVCLPEEDAGGPGPRLESWAVALDALGLATLIRAGALAIRTCKVCPSAAQGIIVGGEYGMSAALLHAGLNFATLMSRYAPGVDWRDRRHWGCNDNVHPSRHGTYAGISFHPYETLFVKSSWHVADPYTSRYSRWVIDHAHGDAGTGGSTDLRLYRYAISDAAQNPGGELERAYNISSHVTAWADTPAYYY